MDFLSVILLLSYLIIFLSVHTVININHLRLSDLLQNYPGMYPHSCLIDHFFKRICPVIHLLLQTSKAFPVFEKGILSLQYLPSDNLFLRRRQRICPATLYFCKFAWSVFIMTVKRHSIMPGIYQWKTCSIWAISSKNRSFPAARYDGHDICTLPVFNNDPLWARVPAEPFGSCVIIFPAHL